MLKSEIKVLANYINQEGRNQIYAEAKERQTEELLLIGKKTRENTRYPIGYLEYDLITLRWLLRTCQTKELVYQSINLSQMIQLLRGINKNG